MTFEDAGSQQPVPDSLRIRHAALRGVAATERLLLLDDLWTMYVERSRPADVRRDLSDIEALVGDMTAGLDEVRDAAAAIRPVLAAVDDDAVELAVWEAVRGHPEGEELTAFLREATQPEGMRVAMLAAAEYVIAEAEPERRMLEEQLGSLRSDAEAAGDLRLNMKCSSYLLKTALYVVGTGLLGVAAGLANPLVLAGTILVEGGIVIDAIKGFKESDCRRHRPQPAPA